MRLLKLTIDNIKCLSAFSLEAGGGNLSIYAENGVGKTTVADAYYWLLFGKDSLGRKDCELKPVGKDGEPVHFLDHRVEGVFEMAGGETLTLERVYRESWETQRGSSTKSFKGHVTAFTVNGVPQSATEYTKRIAAICDEEQFRLLTDPARFLALPWQDRRRMLFDVCGDMTDAEVIEATPDLKPLGELVGTHPIADFKRMTEAQRAATKDERATIPARIDEANRALPAEDGTDWPAALKKRETALSKLQNERSSLQAGGKTAELRARIVEIDAERKSIEADYRSRTNPAREQALQTRREKDEVIREIEHDIAGLEQRINRIEATVTDMDSVIAERRRAAAAEKAKAYTGVSECPACKRPLPDDQVQAAVEEFNAAKARRLDSMIEAGKKLVAERGEMAAAGAKLRETLAEKQKSLETRKTELAAIVIPEDVAADPLGDPRYAELGTQRAETVQELGALTADSDQALETINQRIAEAAGAVAEAQRGIAAARQRADGLVRIEELKARERELSALHESLEQSLFLCEQFVRAKVRMLTDRINRRFERTTFRLFKDQINGGLTECCDVLWRENEALPSNGQAVQIGLDIISTLSAHVGFAPPIFVDNAESVTDLPSTQGQQIRLVVSKGDKDLRIARDDTAAANSPAALF